MCSELMFTSKYTDNNLSDFIIKSDLFSCVKDVS